jgi:hypothetical protein
MTRADFAAELAHRRAEADFSLTNLAARAAGGVGLAGRLDHPPGGR